MGATLLGQPRQQEQQPGRRGLEAPDFAGDFAVQYQAHARHNGLLVNVETTTTPVNDFHLLPPPKARRQRGDLIDELYQTCSGRTGAPWHNQGRSRSPGPTRKRASRTKEKTDLCADNAQASALAGFDFGSAVFNFLLPSGTGLDDGHQSDICHKSHW